MPHAFGYRARTRDLFSRPYRQHGVPHLQKRLVIYKVGDYVDLVGNGAIHKGMPHKFYHGKTGRVYNISKQACGVIINKQVRNRIVKKRVHVRIEHLRKSQCREAFKARCKDNDARKVAAKKEGKIISTKRLPKGTQPEHTVDTKKGETLFLNPLKFREVF